MTDETTVTMGELRWEEFAARAGGPVYVPVGSTEQHGPHLPLNVDTAIATGLSNRLAREAGGVVAPPVSYGAHSQTETGGGRAFPGTTGISGETLRRVLTEVVEALVADGCRYVVLVNGHYENESFVRAAADRVLDGTDEVDFLVVNWWDLLSEATMDELFAGLPNGFQGWGAEHAGMLETALMLYFRPELVDRDAIDTIETPESRPYVRKPAPEETVPSSGAFYDPGPASASMGERVVDECVAALTDVLAEWGD